MQKTQRQTQRNDCKKCFANTFLGFPLLNNGEERKEEKCAIPLEIGGWGIWHQCESEIDPMSPLCLSEDPTIRTGKARPHSSGKGRGGPKNIDWQGLSLFPDALPPCQSQVLHMSPWYRPSLHSVQCTDTDHVKRNDCFHLKLSLKSIMADIPVTKSDTT